MVGIAWWVGSVLSPILSQRMSPRMLILHTISFLLWIIMCYSFLVRLPCPCFGRFIWEIVFIFPLCYLRSTCDWAKVVGIVFFFFLWDHSLLFWIKVLLWCSSFSKQGVFLVISDLFYNCWYCGCFTLEKYFLSLVHWQGIL